MKTIAYQGVKGAFSYLTALKACGEDHQFIGLQKFTEVFEVMERGIADYAVIPIENSLIGSIYENYDLLNLYDVHMIQEHFTKIEHCLLTADKNCELRKIKKVLSHPKALEQCSFFFQRHPWIEAVVYVDTAAAAAEIASSGNPEWGAIASECAASLYGLNIFKKGIEDDPMNYTRFVTLTKKPVTVLEANKGSLLLQLEHTPGSVVNVLQEFAGRSMNLTKIESRPLRGSLFEYLFYIDFEFTERQRQEVEDLLSLLGTKVKKLKVMGLYERAKKIA